MLPDLGVWRKPAVPLVYRAGNAVQKFQVVLKVGLEEVPKDGVNRRILRLLQS